MAPTRMVSRPMEASPHWLIEHHAQRRAERHGAIGADAVEGDDLGGAVPARRW